MIDKTNEPGALAGVVLAAGASTRLGHPKQLVTLDGVALVVHAAAQLVEHCDAGIVVVTGAHHEAVVAALAGLELRSIYNPGWAEGVSASIRQGLTGTRGDAAAVLLALADQPDVTAARLGELVAAWRRAPGQIAASRYAGTVGVPAIFPRSYWPQLAALTGDRGAKPVIDAATAVSLVAMPEAANDIDTAADVENLRH